MIKVRHLVLVLFAQFMLSTSAFAWYGNNIDRVAEASANFVEVFNNKDSDGLGQIYTRNGIVKLPNSPAVSGRDNVAAAWQAGFDAGLDSLVLEGGSFDIVGHNRVLENGTYELTIQTPNGPIVQVGTFSVLWRVPNNPNKAPKIIFDTIDAD